MRCSNPIDKDVIGHVEFLLRTRKYSPHELRRIIDSINGLYGTMYDYGAKKFKMKVWNYFPTYSYLWENCIEVADEKRFIM
ncbi:hypothetical protein AVV29_gp114 [Vibrio phage phi 3]|uniref:Uncharacterized protein n=1 Tax=Vibrio phage phi 3 TaxID=1589298 RepID=A0A0B5HAS6_9CAUD|nr:hypothetical protein AVV29_gp114 [Vibrio phage phi 3]AJF40864.1 hypothetical protein SBVP3_0097 [Vibrio phage phi 3]